MNINQIINSILSRSPQIYSALLNLVNHISATSTFSAETTTTSTTTTTTA